MVSPGDTQRDTGDRAENALPSLSPQTLQDITDFLDIHVPTCFCLDTKHPWLPGPGVPGLHEGEGQPDPLLSLELPALDLVLASPPELLS